MNKTENEAQIKIVNKITESPTRTNQWMFDMLEIYVLYIVKVIND